MTEKRVISPVARLSYPYLFRRAEAMNGGEGKYQCELIFEKGADLSELKAAANQAARDKWGDKVPKNLKSPFRNGDTDRTEKDGYAGNVFIGARSKDKPGVVVGRERKPPETETEVYGGCYVRASVTAFAYDQAGNKGISFALNNVWKLRDGDPFGSYQSAEDEFGGSSDDMDEDVFGTREESDADSLL